MTPKGAQKRKWPFSVIKCTSLEESRYKVQNFFVWILSATKLWRIYWPIYPCKMISGGRRLRSENLAETYPPPSSIANPIIRPVARRWHLTYLLDLMACVTRRTAPAPAVYIGCHGECECYRVSCCDCGKIACHRQLSCCYCRQDLMDFIARSVGGNIHDV